MKVLLIGTGRVDYVSKKTGKEVKGWNLYVTREPGTSESSRVTGEIAESLYVPDTFDISFLAIGSPVEVSFNRFGGVESIESC